jgi:hypothetical protein
MTKDHHDTDPGNNAYVTRRGRPITAANDNDTVRRLRGFGLTFRQIADRLNIGIASAHRAITPQSLPRPRLAANDNKVVRRVAHNGGCSTTSGMVEVSLPRVATLERVSLEGAAA